MFKHISKSLQDLGNPSIARLVGKAILLSLGLLIGLIVTIWLLLQYAIPHTDYWYWMVQLGGIAGAILLSWVLFPVFVTAFTGFYQEEIVKQILKRSYPSAPALRHIGMAENIGHSINFLLVGIILNLAALPVFLLLLFISPLYPVVFYVVNGYLLGREYFLTIALLQMPRKDAMRLWESHRRKIIIAGFFFAFLLTIPVVNLIAPIIATSMMVHILADMLYKEK